MKKQKITAVFSNGFTDIYNGVRPVTAAWMITKKETGQVYKSGHSLDRTTAAKTAAGNLPVRHYGVFNTKGNTIQRTRYQLGLARAAGFKTIEELLLQYKRENAELASQYQIEIVDI